MIEFIKIFNFKLLKFKPKINFWNFQLDEIVELLEFFFQKVTACVRALVFVSNHKMIILGIDEIPKFDNIRSFRTFLNGMRNSQWVKTRM